MDVLKFAVNMELDGEKYYIEQAVINQKNALNTVFLMLAKEERNHAKLLTCKMEGTPYDLNEPVPYKIKSVFKGMVDFKSDIKDIPKQLDVYRLALEKEKESIDLYKKLLSQADKERELFEYLIKQEERHFEMMEEIVKLVNRPNEWVEAAEFGIREDY